jgi:thioredoxin-related protein
MHGIEGISGRLRQSAAGFRNAAGALILAWAVVAPGALAAGVPAAADLAADLAQARAKRVPLLVLFSLPDCGYCERVRQEFLYPLRADPQWRDRFILRQVDVGSAQPLRDLAGGRSTHGKFAAAQGIRLAPTVKVFDAEGREASEPLVGLLTPELYGLYLERALEEGLARARQGRDRPRQ